MSSQSNVPNDSRKLEVSQAVRKAERKMLANYVEKLNALSGLLQTQKEGYLRLLAHTVQDIEGQISQISKVIKQTVKRLNTGWPASDIRKAKANELRSARKIRGKNGQEENLDTSKAKHFRNVLQGGER
ncbi:MAG: hypothetical protein SPL08_05620 [Pseudomonadota bacterium]|nr:hypothetical protein [Pseudomonadota bacterium]